MTQHQMLFFMLLLGLLAAEGGLHAAPPLIWESEFGDELTQLTGADDESQRVRLNFKFPFFGVAYQYLYVSTDGRISLGADATPPITPELPADFIHAKAPMIAPFWSDLDLTEEGAVHFNDFGERAVITWSSVGSFANPQAAFTFQAHLSADGRITFGYDGIAEGEAGGETLVGVSQGGGKTASRTHYTSSQLYRPSLSSNAYQFTLDGTIYETFHEEGNRFNLDGGNLIFIPTPGTIVFPSTEPVGPQANFSADPLTGDEPSLEVTFTDTSIPGDLPIESWAWDFENDGVIDSTERRPVHTYPAPGVYTVKLEVSDGVFSDVKIKESLITIPPPLLGDLDGDAQIPTDDAQLILEYVAGLIDEFPVASRIGAAPRPDQPRRYTVSVPSMMVAPQAGRVVVPIYLSERNRSTDAIGGGVTLAYDPAALAATGVSLSLNVAYYGRVNYDRAGEVRIAFLTVAPISLGEAEKIATVEFAAQPGANVRSTELILSHVQLSHSTTTRKTNGVLTFPQPQDVTAMSQLNQSEAQFNRRTGTHSLVATWKNIGADTFSTPLLMVIERISPDSIHLLNPDGVTPEGKPFYDFSLRVVDGRLDPDETSAAKPLVFYNPDRARLELEVRFWAMVDNGGAAPPRPFFVRQASLAKPIPIVVPAATAAGQNFPNPFNPETWMPFELADASEVKITIYDIYGRPVRELDLGHREAGSYTAQGEAAYWDGKNHQGEPVSGGIYFYRIQAGDFQTVRKMILIK